MRLSHHTCMFMPGFLNPSGPLEAPAGRTTWGLCGLDNYCYSNPEGTSHPLTRESRE